MSYTIADAEVQVEEQHPEYRVIGQTWDHVKKAYTPDIKYDRPPTQSTCACGSDAFKVYGVHASIWAVHIVCTKCGKLYEVATE